MFYIIVYYCLYAIRENWNSLWDIKKESSLSHYIHNNAIHCLDLLNTNPFSMSFKFVASFTQFPIS